MESGEDDGDGAGWRACGALALAMEKAHASEHRQTNANCEPEPQLSEGFGLLLLKVA